MKNEPMPNDQRPVAGETEQQNKGSFSSYNLGYQAGFHAGAAEQAKRDKGKIENHTFGLYVNEKELLLAALDGAKMDGK